MKSRKKKIWHSITQLEIIKMNQLASKFGCLVAFCLLVLLVASLLDILLLGRLVVWLVGLNKNY